MKLKSVYEGKKNCCGCSACFNVCPVNAIEMKPDEEGFLYPEINESKCIDCHKCIEICPIIKDNHYKNTAEPEFYVAKHKSKDVLVNSASGGAFTALSDVIISDDGVVYGADFDENFKVMHRRTATSEQRNRMRISKYAQSDIMDIFSQVKKDLEDGRKVLFSGTPCQNAGLKGYLGSLI